MSRVLRVHILLFLRLIIVITRGVKFSPDANKFQVIPCFWPVLGLLRHVEQRAKQALTHVLCDMHDIKAMRTAEETPVFQIPENRLRFPYPHQRLSLIFFLSRRGAPFPSFQQVVDFFAAPSSWGVLGAPRSHRTDVQVFSTSVSWEATLETPGTQFLKIQDLSLAGDTLYYPCT